MRVRFISLFVILVGALTLAPAAQTTPAQTMLEAAKKKEVVDGDVKGALQQYQVIVDRYGKSDRAVAAQALLRMAEAHQKLGDARARREYQQIVTDYADQQAVLAVARRQLLLLGGGGINQAPERGIGARMISGHYSLADTVTADGRFLTFSNSREGVIRDLQTGEERRIVLGHATTGDVDEYFAEGLTFSPTGSELAFVWVTPDANELRVISRDGGNVRTVFRQPTEFQNFNIKAWSPDGRSLLVTAQKPLPDRSVQLMWVDVPTGSLRVLRTFDSWQNEGYGHSIGTVSLSPDGGWIAYSMVEREGARDRHLYLMAADGSAQHRLTSTAGISQSPVWTPDGTQVLFIADWAGNFGLWSVPVRDGRPGGSATPLKADMGRADPIGVTASGTYVYNYRYDGGDRTFVARLAGMPSSATPASRVAHDFSGGFAQWSPDGTRVAFIRRRTSGGVEIDELGVRVVATGEERLFTARPISPRTPIWFHAKDAVLVWSQEAVGTLPGFYTVDLKTGLFTRTASARSEAYRRTPIAALSPDDRTLYAVADPVATSEISLDHLIAIDLANGTERLVLSLPPTPTRRVAESIGLDVSPDGRTLAVVSRPGIRGAFPEYSDDTVLFTVGVDGLGFRQVYAPFSNASDAKLAWSHDGRDIYFVHSSKDPYKRFNWQIAKIAVTGGTPVAIGFDLVAFRPDPEGVSPKNTDPRFDRLNGARFRNIDLSPDGSQLLFSSDVDPKYEVWALDRVVAKPAAR